MIKKNFASYLMAILFIAIGCNRNSFFEEVGKTEIKHLNEQLEINLFNGNDLPCGTVHDGTIESFEKNMSPLTIQSLSNNPNCVQLAFYIVRESNGSGGFNPADIPELLRKVNDVFNVHNIFFFNVGIHYIDNSDFTALDVRKNTDQLPALIASGNNPDAISFYLVPSVFNEKGEIGGKANGIPSKHLVVHNAAAYSHTPAHEIGHCLNLLHTHETAYCEEAINGSNCATCGDLVCDTPADPGLIISGDNQNVSGCIYTGGNGYTPLVENIMGYANHCRESFTNGQMYRSLAALSLAPVLQPIISSSCEIPEISGPNSLCNATVYTLNNIPANTTVTWSTKPYGIVTLSDQTSNSITANQVADQDGTVQLRAHILYNDGNRITVSKSILAPSNDVPAISLKPESMQCMSMGSTRSINAGYSENGSYQSIDNHPNVAEIDWKVIDHSTSPSTLITSFQKFNTNVIGSSISLSIPYKSNDYVLTVLPRAKHKCGMWGDWGPGYAYYIKNNCTSPSNALEIDYDTSTQRYSMTLSDSYEKIRKAISMSPSNLMQTSNGYDLTIYDNNHIVIYTKKQSNDSKINLPKIPSGDYTVELLQDGYIYSQILNIK